MKKIILFFLICAFILSGCRKDQEYDTEPDRSVVVSLFTSTASASLLKSTGGTTSENRIDKVVLFGVDGSDNVVGGSKTTFTGADIALLAGTGKSLNISRRIKKFYAVANPPSTIEAANPANVSDLQALTHSVTSVPASPFLMEGEAGAGSGNVAIQLTRSVARVDIQSTAAGFTITSVTVQNTPDAGYVFKQSAPSVPASGNRISYATVGNASSSVSVYVVENIAENPTEFNITGTLAGGGTANYTLTLKSGNEAFAITRNTIYTISVTPVTDSECTYSVASPQDWNDVVADSYQLSTPPADPYENGIKILAIGNSFSDNSMRFMVDLLQQIKGTGYTSNVLLVNAYLGGSTLEEHAIILNGGSVPRDDGSGQIQYVNLYGRQEFSAGGVAGILSANTLSELIEGEEWDVISLQQGSVDSYISSTYSDNTGDLTALVNYVNQHKRNQNCKLVWNMTWAYHGYFSQYYSQVQPGYFDGFNDMYEGISNAVQENIVPKLKGNPGGVFDFIIPAGTAIQNARELFGPNAANTFVPSPLSGDFMHLNRLGSYVAGVMWIKAIFGYELADLAEDYSLPDNGYNDTVVSTIDATAKTKVIQAVKAAAANPYAVTTDFSGY